MVLGVGGVYNSRVLLGLTKTSQKSISCVFFVLFVADVDTSYWVKVTGSMLQGFICNVNKRWRAQLKHVLHKVLSSSRQEVTG